jgi:arabinose-5-phosphate isomerase
MAAEQILDLAGEVLATEAQTLLEARARLNGGFVASVDLIHAHCPSGKVVVMGVGKSGHVGNKIAATLASTGTPAFFVHPTEAGHGDLGMIASTDVVIAISYSGKSDELLRVVPYFKRNSIPLIALTGDAASPLAAHADAWIDGSVDREACPLGLAPTASTTLALALGDALAICLLRKRGFTHEEFAATHPHGLLGRRLLVTVRDIMLKGDEVPRTSPETSIRACLSEMSRGGIGVVGVTDADNVLLGVFTDGDIRRVLDGNVDIFNTPISSAMTRNPTAMKAHQLAAEAAEVMERRKISAIPVIDDAGKLVGAFNMRILLRSGVV